MSIQPQSQTQTPPQGNLANNHPVFQQYEAAKQLGGKFLKINPGERLALQFNLNRIEFQESEYDGKKTGGQSAHFSVIDPREPTRERTLSMGVKKAEGIMALLKKGVFLLEIQKVGSGKEAQYIATPVY